MAKLNFRVEQLRGELRDVKAEGGLAWSSLPKYSKRVAALVLDALGDDDHKLTEQMHELQELMKEYPAGEVANKTRRVGGTSRQHGNSKTRPARKKPSKQPPRLVLSTQHFFMPHPGISLTHMRRFWRLQLLLLVASVSEDGKHVADSLGLTVAEWKNAVAKGCKDSVSYWSALQLVERLDQALAWMDQPEGDAPVRLEGSVLCQGGLRVRLSAKQYVFVRKLLANPGALVSGEVFQKLGISGPTKIKHDLMKKLQKKGVTIVISSENGGYVFREGA